MGREIIYHLNIGGCLRVFKVKLKPGWANRICINNDGVLGAVMKSCDDCPGSTLCSGHNLRPVLVRVLDLYGAGMTDKFDILFALGDADEEILEHYTAHVSRACWTKAALLAIVEVVVRLQGQGLSPDAAIQHVHRSVHTARSAFSRFPWNLDELVEQAPELHALIVEQCPDAALCDALGKRAFVKMCKDIVRA